MVEAAGPCRCEEDLLGVVERRCCTMEVEIKKKKKRVAGGAGVNGGQ
jgi:hypothetical protein